MGEVSILTDINSLPSFCKFQFTAPRALLEALLQLNEPDSMHVNVSTPNDVPFELSIKRTSDDNIQIQADGGTHPVLEGVDDRWSFGVKSVDGPIYLITGSSDEEQAKQQQPELETQATSLLVENSVQPDNKTQVVLTAHPVEGADSSVASTFSVNTDSYISTAVEVEKAYPEIVRSLQTNQDGLQDADSEEEGDIIVDMSKDFKQTTSQHLRTDVDLLLAAIEASNAAEKKTDVSEINALQKRKRGRPRKLRLETPDGMKEEEILAVMEEIPLIIQDVLTFKCYVCEKAFTSIDTVKSHMKSKHDVKMDESSVTTSTLVQAHICFVCHRPTAGMKSLRKHLLGVHRLKYSKPRPKAKSRYVAKGLRRNPKDPNTPAVACGVCGKKVISWDNLRNHTKKLHKHLPNLEEILRDIRNQRLKHHKRQSVVKVNCPFCEDQFAGLPVISHIKSVHGSSMEKDCLKDLIIQVKKDIQKAYNDLKKERKYLQKTFECFLCKQTIFYRNKQSHMQSCRQERMRKRYSTWVNNKICSSSSTQEQAEEESGAGNNKSTVQQSSKLEDATEKQSQVKLVSLLNTNISTPVETIKPANPVQQMSTDVSFVVVKSELASGSGYKIADDSEAVAKIWEQTKSDQTGSDSDSSPWPKSCPTCGKVFNTTKAMAHHRRYVHFEELRSPMSWHECEICHKKMPNKNRYDKHMIVHTGLRLFQCDKCDRAFKDKYTLNTHVRTIHDKNYRYTCKKCGRGWDKIVGLNAHTCYKASLPSTKSKVTTNPVSKGSSVEDKAKAEYVIIKSDPEVEEGEINYLLSEAALSNEDENAKESAIEYAQQGEVPTIILSEDAKLRSPCMVGLSKMETQSKDSVICPKDRGPSLKNEQSPAPMKAKGELRQREASSVQEDQHIDPTSRKSARSKRQKVVMDL